MLWYNLTMNRAEKRSQKRKEVVEAVVLRKEPVNLVARIYNIPLRTVFDWLACYRQGGWHGLIEKNRQGRPKKIGGDDMKWLYDAITMGNPLNYKLPFCLWSLNTIRAMLQKEREVLLSKSSICRLLGHLGLTPQKPLYKSYKQDPDKIKDYLDKTYPEAVAQAKKYHARLYFLDEAAFRSDAHRGTTWGKCGETPVVKDSGGRFGFKLISAVSARGDMHFDVIDGSMDAERFISFLQKLRQDAGCPVFAIADNARYHHSKKVRAFLETQAGEIMMAFLPPYSPELNPDEQVWNHAKAEVAKHPIKSKLEMEALILSAMLSIQQKIELVKSFFRLPDTLYAEMHT
jgi:transposase